MLILSAKQYFAQAVEDAFEKRKIETYPQVSHYLVDLLERFVVVQNLYDEKYDELGNPIPQTLAEMYMVAAAAEGQQRTEMLRKMADRSLYISGFFGDSLSRKVVDIDYYADMGGAAYEALALQSKADLQAKIYRTFSKRFLDFVEVLTYISDSSQLKADQNILRLYDRYMRTGSELAREKLIELGVNAVPLELAPKIKQG